MKLERIESIKIWLELKFIREIQVFIGFANFSRRFIQSFITIAEPLTSILKISPGFKSSKPAKKSIVITIA